MRYYLLILMFCFAVKAQAQTCTDLVVAEYPLANIEGRLVRDTVYTQAIQSTAKNKKQKDELRLWLHRDAHDTIKLYVAHLPQKFREKDGNILWTMRFENGILFRLEGEQNYILDKSQYIEYNFLIMPLPAALLEMMKTQMLVSVEIRFETPLADKILPYTLDAAEANKLTTAARCLGAL